MYLNIRALSSHQPIPSRQPTSIATKAHSIYYILRQLHFTYQHTASSNGIQERTPFTITSRSKTPIDVTWTISALACRSGPRVACHASPTAHLFRRCEHLVYAYKSHAPTPAPLPQLKQQTQQAQLSKSPLTSARLFQSSQQSRIHLRKWRRWKLRDP